MHKEEILSLSLTLVTFKN